MFQVHAIATRSVRERQVVLYLIASHLVKTADVNERVEHLGREELQLLGLEKTNSSALEVLPHIFVRMKRTKAKDAFVGKYGGQIPL